MGAPAVAVAQGQLSRRVERRLREVTLEQTGIVLGPDKTALIASRVQKRLRVLELPDFEAYIDHLDTHPEEVPQFVSVITTHTTSFFRERTHFPILVEQLQTWVREGQRRFRLWCAAASTGQEPWTMAMVVAPLVEKHALDLKILATDIDAKSLHAAHRAVYPAGLVAQVPTNVRETSFEPVPDGFRVREHIRRLVRYTTLNLAKPPFPMQGPLDVVMCRNVMIYLDPPTRKRLVLDVERILRPGGLLLVGHSESVMGLGAHLVIDQPSVYRMPAAP